MKRTLSRFSLFLLFAAALPIFANETRQREGFGDVKVIERIELKPTADTELTLADASIVELEDGTRRVRIAVPLTHPEERFFYKVDVEAQTYTAWYPDSPAIPEQVRNRNADRGKARSRLSVGADTIYDPPPNCGLPQGPTFEPCESPCSGDSNAVLTYYDAAWNWLADTEGNLHYSRGGLHGCRWFSWMTGHCVANSNAGGKVWSTTLCNILTAPPFLNGGSGSIEGRYTNTNGGNVNLATNARHWLQINYSAPATIVLYEYSITGEVYTTFIIEFYAWANGYCSPY